MAVSGMWRPITDKVREWPEEKRRRMVAMVSAALGVAAAFLGVAMVASREGGKEEGQKTGADMLEPDGTYVVKQGDTLYSVANRLDTTVTRLAEANECPPAARQQEKPYGRVPAQEKRAAAAYRRQQEPSARSAPAPVEEPMRKGTCVRDAGEIYVGQVLKIPEPLR